MTRTIVPATLLALCALVSSAAADPRVTVTPAAARPGDAVLVTVTGTKDTPKGEVGGTTLRFFAARRGFQAVFAIPLDATPAGVSVDVAGVAKPVKVKVKAVTFPDVAVVVEDEMANPPKPERDRIDADNHAILSVVGDAGAPQFVKPFLRPRGRVSSTFGEWRTFNDGHRSQHLGFDIAARAGVKIAAINAGTVVLVRDGFLTGQSLVIAHGGGIASAYYHLSKTLVVEGDKVQRGATIGLVGATGRTTGPHLHLSIRVPGGFVDPATFFRPRLAPKPPRL